MREPIGFRRGDLVTVAPQGGQGKLRPALVVQALVPDRPPDPGDELPPGL